MIATKAPATRPGTSPDSTTRTTAVLVGAFILIAYGVLVELLTDSKPVVLFSDVISGLAVIGIAVLMFRFFEPAGSATARSYFGLKMVEGILMVMGGLFFLSDSFQDVRVWFYDYPHYYVFIVSGFLFYVLLYRSELVPRFFALWGMVAIAALALDAVLAFFDASNVVIEAMLVLIITNEVALAVWLMVNGFNPAAVSRLTERGAR